MLAANSFQLRRVSPNPNFLSPARSLFEECADLPYSAGECRLQKEFSCFGPIAEVKLVKDAITKKSKGYAFIQYTSQDAAMLALENMDEKYFDGRVIHVELAKPGKDMYGGIPIASGPPEETTTRYHHDGLATKPEQQN